MVDILKNYDDFTMEEAYERALYLLEKGYLEEGTDLDEVAIKIFETNSERINKYRKEKKEELKKDLGIDDEREH